MKRQRKTKIYDPLKGRYSIQIGGFFAESLRNIWTEKFSKEELKKDKKGWKRSWKIYCWKENKTRRKKLLTLTKKKEIPKIQNETPSENEAVEKIKKGLPKEARKKSLKQEIIQQLNKTLSS